MKNKDKDTIAIIIVMVGLLVTGLFVTKIATDLASRPWALEREADSGN